MKRSLLVLLISMPLISMAQSNFNKGYVINNAQDTIRGFINYTERTTNPTSIAFKSSLDGRKEEFSIKDYSSYTISGLVSFERFVVNISLDKAGINGLSTGIDTTTKRDTVFLKVLQKGKNLTLFSYQDDIKERFYYKGKDDVEPLELIRHNYFGERDNSQVFTKRKYATQLLLEMEKLNLENPAERRKVKYLNYTQSDMIKAAAILNAQEVVKSQFARARFFVGAGVAINQVKYTGDNRLSGANGSSKTSFGPLFTAGIDLFANPAIGKLIARVEASFYTSKSEVTENNPNSIYHLYRESFNSNMFSISPQIIYNVYNGNDLKVFVGAGISINISSYSNKSRTRVFKLTQPDPVTVEDINLKFERMTFAFPFTAGVVLKKRVEIFGGYAVASPIAEFMNYNIKLHTYKAGVRYLFGKH